MRRIGFVPPADFFKPSGIPLCDLEQVTLTLDEVESLRLADLNGLYQEQAAEKMKISRPTFSRVIEAARKKVADALIHGKALRMEGGAVVMKGACNMPGRGGAGPVGSGRGMGRGPCGCGSHRGAGSGQGAGGCGRRRMRRGPSADEVRGLGKSTEEKGSQAS